MTGRPDRPILITGTPRSGKTLINKVLRQMPEFTNFEEAQHLWYAIPISRGHDRLDESDVTPRLARQIVSRCTRAVAARKARRYLDAYSFHALAIPFVFRVMPEAKVIHVIRDPAETVPEMIFGWTNKDPIVRAIYRRKKIMRLHTLPRQAIRFAMNFVQSRLTGRRISFGPRVPGMKEFAATHSTAEIAAYQWEQMVRIARTDLSKAPAGQWLEVRYEHIIADPARAFRRIAEFAEVEDVEAAVERAVIFVEPDRLVETRVEPTPEEWERIWARMGDLADELGYAPPFDARGTAARRGA